MSTTMAGLGARAAALNGRVICRPASKAVLVNRLYARALPALRLSHRSFVSTMPVVAAGKRWLVVGVLACFYSAFLFSFVNILNNFPLLC
jgi:hypothetical protein